MFAKVLISYILILFIPLISMGTFSFLWVGNILKNQTQQSYNAMIKEFQGSFDEQLKQLDDLSILFTYTPWVSKVMYMQSDRFDYDRMSGTETVNAVAELKGYDLINDFIDTVALIFPKQNYVISSSGVANADTFFTDVYKMEGIDYTYLKDNVFPYGIPQIIGPKDLYHSKISRKCLMYIRSLPSAEKLNRVFLVAYIDEEQIIPRLKRYQISKDSSIYILSGDGRAITGVNHNIEALSQIQRAISIQDGNISSMVKIGSKKYFVFYKASDINELKYVITIPYDTVMLKVNHMKIIVTVIALLLLIIGMIISYCLAVRNYDPLASLVNIMQSRFSYNEISYRNEYDYLKSSLTSLLSEEDILRKTAEKQKPIIRNAYFLRFLTGNISESEVNIEFLNSLGVELPFANFVSILIVLDIDRGIRNELQELINIEAGKYNSKAYFVEVDGARKVIILNIKEHGEIKNLVSKLKEIIEDRLQITCAVGVGKSYINLGGVINSYNEALKAIDYRFLKGKDEIIYFNDIHSDNGIYYYYPLDKETGIINALRRSDLNTALSILNDIVSTNIVNDGIHPDNIKWLFYNLMGTALKLLYDLKLYDLVCIDKEKINTFTRLDDMQQYLIEVYKKISEVIEKNKTCHNDVLKEAILDYIDRNFIDPNLSLNSMAVSIGRSVPYLSKFFKEQMGSNFLDYLNRKRIKKAKELLNGQMTITQISELVGFNSDVAFRRVFKKYEGITPGEYIETNEDMRQQGTKE